MSSIQVKKDTMTEDTVIVIQMWLRTKSLDQQAVETDPSVSIRSTGHNGPADPTRNCDGFPNISLQNMTKMELISKDMAQTLKV